MKRSLSAAPSPLPHIVTSGADLIKLQVKAMVLSQNIAVMESLQMLYNFKSSLGMRISDILYEHVQHLFSTCQQVSLNSVFRENSRLTARNPSNNSEVSAAVYIARL